jgi:hypothetical protein
MLPDNNARMDVMLKTAPNQSFAKVSARGLTKTTAAKKFFSLLHLLRILITSKFHQNVFPNNNTAEHQ